MAVAPRPVLVALLPFAVVLAAALACIAGSRELHSQGVTTAAIHGVVRAEHGGDADGALVRVVNRSTGFSVESAVRDGRFVAFGLEVGGPYSIIVRRPGFVPQSLDVLDLSIGQRLEIAITLTALSTRLDTVRVAATVAPPSLQPGAGVGGKISDSTLRRMPTRNRDIYDFVQLVPQVSTRFGISGAGVNPRYNGYLIDGVSERALQGNAVAGVGTGGKAISVEAVKEYQVLLSPYAVRYGDFAGALVNTVTRSGTNTMHGSGFVYTRSDRLARDTPFLRDSPYERLQFGVALGGPVVRNRAHFFVAAEFQRLTAPTGGPYLGQSVASEPPVPVRAEDVAGFARILGASGLDAGSAGRVDGHNPLVNVFGRVDVDLPAWHSRLVVRHNFDRVRGTRFSRPVGTSTFPLSSIGFTQELTKYASSAHLVTYVRRNWVNELTGAYLASGLRGIPYSRGPSIAAAVTHASGTGTATLQAGTNELAQDVDVQERTFQLADDLTLSMGARQTVSIGVRIERFDYHVRGVNGSFGRWRFSSLDALEAGTAQSYRLVKDFGTGRIPVRGTQVSAYAGDEWRATDHLTLTAGLRADALLLDDSPVYAPSVDSIFASRTTGAPSRRVRVSPRVAFDWEPGDDRRSRVRGGAGIFVGRPPLAWIGQAFRNNGSGIRTLSCGSAPGDSGPPPSFRTDYRYPPGTCSDGGGFGDGPVALLSRNLTMAETFRASLAYERLLPWALAGTLEGSYTRNLSDFIFVNANLAGPQRVDRHGRVMYGSVDARGRATPAVVSQFPEVIDLRNHGGNYSYGLAARLQRRFSERLEATAAYAFSRVRDVQSATSIFPGDAWAGGRAVSGRHDDMTVGVSSFEVPHRVVVGVSAGSPWKRWSTDVSIYYVGESGSAFTYVDSAGSGLGDLNADGTNANDPIYVPRSAFDSSEIRFSGLGADTSSGARAGRVAAQQAAFDRFIAGSACLRGQRGRIVARNSCRGPWVHAMHASVRQSLPLMRGHTLALQLEVFNLLNLLNPKWGLYRVPNPVALTQVDQVTEADGSGQPVFWFEPTRQRYSTRNIESGYQLQVAARYSF
ncbi:MAG TPA: carboxypeptidase regulatory-like domain-containing protein [Gemmatimonadaceae bacterium]|nr:carboxypeptidase regulatory-like domain-containing protein [Gemmatimonadaceae bacterium]